MDDERDFPLPGVEFLGDVDVARTSQEARDLLDHEEYDYIFLDYDLGLLDTANSVMLKLMDNGYSSVKKIWIHSQNSVAAAHMHKNLQEIYDVERYLWRS